MPSLLDPADMALLARLDLVRRRPEGGMSPGERRSPRTARSPEFADFRPYVSGDDLRQIDWRAFARLDRLVLRLHVAEEEAALNVVVDASPSMTLGSPPKWPAARRLAGAIAVLGLTRMDRVAVGVLGCPDPHTAHVRGADGVRRVLAFLDGLEPGAIAGPEDLTSLRWLRPGLTVVVSDFLVEQTWDRALATLRASRQETVLWQVLAPDEEAPELAGDFALVDVETGQRHEITVTAGAIADYVAALGAHRQDLRRQAAATHGRFLHTRSSDDVRASMLAGVSAGVVRSA